jgi:predicted DNA-binding transcriptional regulator AlpA
MTPAPRLHVTLEDLARDAHRVGDVSKEGLPALMAQAAGLMGILAARAAELATVSAPAVTEERLLDVAEAAKLLGVTEDWLYREPALPFKVRVGANMVRFSYLGILKWIRQKTG